MTNLTTLVIILLSYTALGSPSRVWAVEREQLHFYTRVGSHQMDSERPILSVTPDISVEQRPLDIGAGMNYRKGGIHLQLGPTFDLTTPSLLLQQKVFVEGQIGVRW